MTRNIGPNPEAARAFFDTVQLRQNNWGSHGVPRASSVGNCLRQQYFNLLRDEYPPVPISGESLWGMAEGNRQEEPIYEVLREQGYMVHSVQAGVVRYLDNDGAVQAKRVPDDERMKATVAALRRTGQTPFMTVHIDGIIEDGPDKLPPALLELKKATMFSFGGMVQNQIMSDKPTYDMQSAVGAGSFGLDMARFYVFSRDKSATEWYFTKMRSKNPILENPALYVEDVVINPKLLQVADYRARYVLGAVQENAMPEPDPGISPLNVRVEKDGEMTTLFPCGWCEWREHCLQAMHKKGVNINEFVVQSDLRTKADKEKDARIADAIGGMKVDGVRLDGKDPEDVTK